MNKILDMYINLISPILLSLILICCSSKNEATTKNDPRMEKEESYIWRFVSPQILYLNEHVMSVEDLNQFLRSNQRIIPPFYIEPYELTDEILNKSALWLATNEGDLFFELLENSVQSFEKLRTFEDMKKLNLAITGNTVIMPGPVDVDHSFYCVDVNTGEPNVFLVGYSPRLSQNKVLFVLRYPASKKYKANENEVSP